MRNNYPKNLKYNFQYNSKHLHCIFFFLLKKAKMLNLLMGLILVVNLLKHQKL